MKLMPVMAKQADPEVDAKQDRWDYLQSIEDTPVEKRLSRAFGNKQKRQNQLVARLKRRRGYKAPVRGGTGKQGRTRRRIFTKHYPGGKSHNQQNHAGKSKALRDTDETDDIIYSVVTDFKGTGWHATSLPSFIADVGYLQPGRAGLLGPAIYASFGPSGFHTQNENRLWNNPEMKKFAVEFDLKKALLLETIDGKENVIIRPQALTKVVTNLAVDAGATFERTSPEDGSLDIVTFPSGEVFNVRFLEGSTEVLKHLGFDGIVLDLGPDAHDGTTGIWGTQVAVINPDAISITGYLEGPIDPDVEPTPLDEFFKKESVRVWTIYDLFAALDRQNIRKHLPGQHDQMTHGRKKGEGFRFSNPLNINGSIRQPKSKTRRYRGLPRSEAWDIKHPGQCYGQAMFMMEKHGGVLVHGVIRGDFREGNAAHAWIRLPDGFIYEPTTDAVYREEDFNDIWNPATFVEYSAEQVADIEGDYQHDGPWDEASNMWYNIYELETYGDHARNSRMATIETFDRYGASAGAADTKQTNIRIFTDRFLDGPTRSDIGTKMEERVGLVLAESRAAFDFNNTAEDYYEENEFGDLVNKYGEIAEDQDIIDDYYGY